MGNHQIKVVMMDEASTFIRSLPQKSTGEDNLQLSEDRTRHHGQGTLQEVGRY